MELNLLTIDRARSALAGGDAVVAVQAVDDYDARFPGGALAQEAAVLRIEALVKLGRLDEAKAAAARVLALQPGFSIGAWCAALDPAPAIAVPLSAALQEAGLPA